MVLDAQAVAIAAVKPGNGWNDPHSAALRVLVSGLVELGLLSGDVDELMRDPEPVAGEDKPREAAYKQFFMHKTGHWLGLDVHDVGDYKRDGQWRTLEPGMVLTVEPGLYVSPADNVDEKWWNIGIRIEDDVLVTPEGHRVLTAGVVKEVADIEALMAQQEPV
ncbi:MAG: M24 family metallopeptidase [Thiolinea sp.]